MDASSPEQQLLKQTDKFGAGPFQAGEIEALSALIKGCPWRRLALPKEHPVYGRLVATIQFQSGDGSSLATSDQILKLSVELLADLSLAPENIEACTETLGSVMDQLDKFCGAHLKPMGHGTDDEILSAFVTLMINVTRRNLGGADMLELVNGRMFAAVAALTSVFRSFHRRLSVSEMLSLPAWREDAQFFVACTRTLYELSQSQTLFLRMTSGSGGGNPNTDRNIADLDREYKSYLASFNKTILGFPIFDYIAATLDSWFSVIESGESLQAPQLLPHFQCGLKYSMQLICNMLCFTTSFVSQLKDHLAKNTVIIQNVTLPYICFALDLLERGVFDPETVSEQHITPLALVVRTISLICYKIKMFRPWLRKFPLLGARLAQNGVVRMSPLAIEWFALIVRFVINADLQDSIPSLLEIHGSLDETQKSLVATKLTSKKEKLYPVNVFSGAYQKLRGIFEHDKLPVAGDEAVTAAASSVAPPPPPTTNKFTFNFDSESGTVKVKQPRGARGGRGGAKGRRNQNTSAHRRAANNARRNRNRRNERTRKRWAKLKEMEQQGLNSAKQQTGGNGDDSESDGPDLEEGEEQKQEEPQHQEPQVTQFRQIQVKEIKLTPEQLMAAADQQMAQVSPSVADKNDYVAPSTTTEIQQKQQQEGAAAAGQSKQWFGVNDSDDEEDDSSSDEDDEGVANGVEVQPGVVRLNAPEQTTTAAPGVSTTTASGGQSLVARKEDLVGANGEDLSPWRKGHASTAIPKQYLCALSRQLITVPVLSPQGEVFDKATILDFLKTMGNIYKCPITGTDLYPNDLVVDHSLRKEIDAVRGNYSR